MSKTDKELTAEIVVAYLGAWSGPNKLPAKQDQLPGLIELVYNTVKNLN